MVYEIDARGLDCPQPVILTKSKMKEFNQIKILVDNETARENIKRLASVSGWFYDESVSGDHFVIALNDSKDQKSESVEKNIAPCINSGTAIVFSSDKMGKGDDELGAILMKAFIHTLASLEPVPSHLVFYNSGVLLTSDGSGVTDDLLVLQEKSVEILICGTCVNYYKIGDKVKAGIISNMSDILDTMNRAARLINP